MLIPLLFLSLTGPASAPPVLASMAAPVSVCADTLETAHARIFGLLRVAHTMDVPVLRGLQAVDTAHLRVLTREADAPVCRTLREKVWPQLGPDRVTGRPWHLAVLEADGFYFVLVSRDRRGLASGSGANRRVVIGEQGPATMYVFDRNFQLVTATRA
jgi:hypothetical protein